MNLTVLNQIVEPSWLARPSTEIAPELLGCTLVRLLPSGQTIRGIIVETEAYAPGDPAFHAYRRRTERNSVVFGPAGRSYIYLIYGLYHCCNIVTDREEIPSAVLIRALQFKSVPPGIDISFKAKLERIAAGPSKLCRVMQIDRSLNGGILQPGQPLWLEHRSIPFQQQLQQHSLLEKPRPLPPWQGGRVSASFATPSGFAVPPGGNPHDEPALKEGFPAQVTGVRADSPGEPASSNFSPTSIQTTRIGISQGTDLPWRWYISNCPAVSKH